MKELALTLVVFASNYANAATLRCLPTDMSNSANVVASEVSVDFDAGINNITVNLKDGRSVSGALVDASDLGPDALALSDDVARKEGINVTVALHTGQVALLVSPYFAMSIPSAAPLQIGIFLGVINTIWRLLKNLNLTRYPKFSMRAF
jgi:hypothetical protein